MEGWDYMWKCGQRKIHKLTLCGCSLVVDENSIIAIYPSVKSVIIELSTGKEIEVELPDEDKIIEFYDGITELLYGFQEAWKKNDGTGNQEAES